MSDFANYWKLHFYDVPGCYVRSLFVPPWPACSSDNAAVSLEGPGYKIEEILRILWSLLEFHLEVLKQKITKFAERAENKITSFEARLSGYGTTPVWCRGGSRYVWGCWGFPYLKMLLFPCLFLLSRSLCFIIFFMHPISFPPILVFISQ